MLPVRVGSVSSLKIIHWNHVGTTVEDCLPVNSPLRERVREEEKRGEERTRARRRRGERRGQEREGEERRREYHLSKRVTSISIHILLDVCWVSVVSSHQVSCAESDSAGVN